MSTFSMARSLAGRHARSRQVDPIRSIATSERSACSAVLCRRSRQALWELGKIPAVLTRLKEDA